jgi:hypothetical protein
VGGNAVEQGPTGALQPGSRSLITPLIDLLCGGGFSILLMGLFLALVHTPLTAMEFKVESIVLVSAIVNNPHFIVSYRLLYTSAETVRRYKWAAIYAPIVLLGYSLYALADTIQIGDYSIHYKILFAIATFYLAVHYTGQAWGTTATFAYVDRISFTKLERGLLKNGLRVLAAWHMVWVMHQQHFVDTLSSKDLFDLTPHETQWVLEKTFLLQAILSVMAMACLLIGAIVFANIWRRTGRMPAFRVVLPWLSIYMWYALIQVMPGAFFWLQISHAIQYLIFPARVEMNRYSMQHPSSTTPDAGNRPMLLHMVFYYVILVALGYAAFIGITDISDSAAAGFVAGIIAVFINIHHYFVDACIWKISSPAVRRDLFAHLQ